MNLKSAVEHARLMWVAARDRGQSDLADVAEKLWRYLGREYQSATAAATGCVIPGTEASERRKIFREAVFSYVSSGAAPLVAIQSAGILVSLLDEHEPDNVIPRAELERQYRQLQEKLSEVSRWASRVRFDGAATMGGTAGSDDLDRAENLSAIAGMVAEWRKTL